MSKNRKRSKTRTLSSYHQEALSSKHLDTRKPEPKLMARKKYTFGLPSELVRSPVHGFYAYIKTD